MSADDIRTLRNAVPPERKALVENTAGLYLVPEELEIEIMRAVPQINTLRNYCRVRPTSRDKVGIRSLTEVSVGWGKLETGSAITESTQTPTKDSIYVEDLYGLSKIGEDELQDSDANLTGLLADSFAVAIANEEAKRFAIGRGHTTYSEPDGVAVDATIIASYKADWTTADTVLINDLLTAEYTLPAQYLNGSVWLMNRKTELAARLLRAEVASGYYGNYLWQPSLLAGQPNSFDGFPIVNQNDMQYPADAVDGINVIFGNLRLGYMILDRMGMTVQRLDELYAEAGLVGFKMHRRVGGGVYRAEAFRGIYNQT
jgi:HK97 family phage major capsid protein